MNHEDTIVTNVGAYIQKLVNLINKGFGATINYTGFEYFIIEDSGSNYKLTLKLNEYTSIVVDTVDKDISSWVVTIGKTQKGRTSSKLEAYISSLFKYLIGEFGENTRSVTFTMEYGKHSDSVLCADTSGEFDITWAFIKPTEGFSSYLDELEANKFHYKHLLLKKKSDEPLSFGEAYYFALKNYNKGGDGFVECTGPEDFEKEKQRGKVFTKKTMTEDFKIYKSICDDRMGWF